MHLHIEHNATEISMELYGFYLMNDCILVLDSYCYQERPSKRHKFRNVSKYNRTLKRDNNIQLSDILIPDEVKEKAFNELVRRIKVVKSIN